MKNDSQNSGSSFFLSVVIHVAVLAVLIFNFDFNLQTFAVDHSEENINVVNAVAVDLTQVEHKIKQVKQIEEQKKQAVVEQEKKLQAEAEQAKRIQEQEEKRVAALNEEQLKVKQKQLEEQNRLALLKQQQLEAKKMAEKQRKKDFAKKKAALMKALAEEVKQEASKEKKIQKNQREIAAKALQEKLLAEQKRLANERTAKMQGVVDKYKALIQQAIGQRWIVPPNVDKKLTCELLIHLGPGGLVLDVQLVKSSGDSALDHSARTAVFKASPLPVPSEAEAFEQFRQFVLKVKPEDLLLTDGA